ncbi:DUF1127 domain-containing protein [Afifella marina]|uniref:YjiS-like domain-containing protein n=1 Tax=Afifella marina DSM 2698 TaxID=1120955 RepID=A0A1G5N5K2_AFIMA|nr:DUF1127 domain-containing protein [Afifella marina]MBK1622421.1 DUF1127 domain-containing protein [Afifella marina DSM 2698]MBK1626865.1 DUF1127 domain-containing protein [Afifella marina]MBK5919205.1 hypothetical protein [Afifella marina]RAI21248.1 hypothetical protein CH311_07160 [Afifella marina DSM 2698]SCZ32009.1 protein of unknown function [Afifella marina DSM 2698]
MKFIQHLLRARRKRNAAHELRGLSPDLLNDIGINPADVDKVAAKMLSSDELPPQQPHALLFKTALFLPIDWPGQAPARKPQCRPA